MNQQTSSRPLVGIAIVVRQDDKILLFKRQGSHAGGMWSVPGGHLEFGESFEDCARREVREEVGVEVTPPTFMAVTNDFIEDKHYISIWMECSLLSGTPTICEPEKMTELCWRSPADLPEPLFEPCWSNLRAIMPAFFERSESSRAA
jgi:8-oxo-dGTP diphosphatase